MVDGSSPSTRAIFFSVAVVNRRFGTLVINKWGYLICWILSWGRPNLEDGEEDLLPIIDISVFVPLRGSIVWYVGVCGGFRAILKGDHSRDL